MRIPILTILFLFISFYSRATERIGAQVWLERGMSQEQIEGHFRTLDQHHMHSARLFMMWNFMETQPGQWDFRIFDYAFDAAKKYNVGIVATLMPNFGPTHRGFYYKTQDGAISKSRRQLEESRMYIQTIVKRYKDHPALSHWMLMNEPGQMPSPDSLAMERFQEFLSKKYGTISTLNQAWLTGFASFSQIAYSPNWAGGGFTWPVSYLDWQNFWAGHLTWYLSDVAAEIRKTDSKTPLHVNPHALLDIPHRYQLSKWTEFLNSLGASIHPVWHFNDLNRSDYPFGVALVCDLVKGAADAKPFWVTELQGGHNLYTGSQPVNPTREEIQAWLWTSLSSGAEKTIYWCLNPRTQGGESGEWALMDYAGQPSHRLQESGRIAGIADEYSRFFAKARPVKDAIVVAVSRETMFLQERNGNGQKQPARQSKAHFLSALACYKALRMKGFHPHFEFTDDIDWTEKTTRSRLVFLPHATAFSDGLLQNLKTFTELGNTLVVSGLTGIFSEDEKIRWNQESAWETLTGLKALEVFTPENEGNYPLPYESFRIRYKTRTAADKGTLLENKLGKGTCITVPAITDLAWYYRPEDIRYPNLLAGIASPFRHPNQTDFSSEIPGSYCQTLSDGNQVLSLVHVPAKKDGEPARIFRKDDKAVRIVNGNGTPVSGEGMSYSIPPGTTFAVLSEKAILPVKP